MNSPRKIKVLVVDDEATARNGLVKMLSDRPDLASVNSCSNGIDAITMLNSYAYDLLLLDIQMPLVDGFDVLRSLKPGNIPYVVFITAYEHYAIKAFEFHAIDYILKPFSDGRLSDIISRVHGLIHDKEQIDKLSKLLEEVKPDSKSIELIEYGSKEKLVFKENGVINFLGTNEIHWIEAYDYYVKIHVTDKVHLVRTSMKKLESSLDPIQFVRIHKSAIINKEEIVNIDTKAGEWVVGIKSGKSLKVGRAYKDDLKSFLKI